MTACSVMHLIQCCLLLLASTVLGLDLFFENRFVHHASSLSQSSGRDVPLDDYVKGALTPRQRIRNNEEMSQRVIEADSTPAEIFDVQKTPLIFLNIGGIVPVEGWYNVNIQYDDTFHENSRDRRGYILRSGDDLHGFPDGSVSVVYSSHTLEHTSAATGETLATLIEWRRVLRPGGVLMVAVPDFELLTRLFLEKTYTDELHWVLVSIMMGGQRDSFDYHTSAFDLAMLTRLLTLAGFCEIQRVSSFNVFPPDHDSSTFQFLYLHVSLNVMARPCVPEGVQTDGFEAEVDFTPYESDYDNIPHFNEEGVLKYPKTG